LVNRDDRFLCERAFAVDTDAEEIMRRESIPLFSLESSRSVSDFDAIGFTLSYELVYTNMLAMLDLARIPIYSRDRTDAHPLIFAGGPLVYNPEPLAAFVDLFFIGDAEEGLPEILEVLHENRDVSRVEKLEQIVRRVDSVYVPSFYDDNRKPTVSFAPEKIRARVVPELKPEYFPRQPIVPSIETVHDHLAIEIMRGCPQGCRFCMAGPIYRPVRARPQHEILDQIEQQTKNSGFAEVSLMSLSTSDYPDIDKLATAAARRLEPHKAGITLPALRAGTIGSAMLDAASKVRKSGLTIAPETGTERLRSFVRKDLSDKAILETVRLVFSKGWTSLKLYFMVGLPSETDEDLQAILDLVRRIYEIGREFPARKTINVSLSPFSPKPHTPFQWDAQASLEDVLRKINFIKHRNRINRVNYKYTGVESTLLQGILGRGGREMGEVIASVFRKGCRFDGWTEHFKSDVWFETFKENGIDINQYLKPIPFDADLPWSHIEKGVSAEHLKKERQRTSSTLRDDDDLPTRITEEVRGEPAVEYGRSKKKVAARNTSAPTKNRLRVRWGKNNRFQYMSHLDNLRMLERLIRRSRFPVAYSQGFNPTMKLSFGPPLPHGFTSECELVEITLDCSISPYMVDDLKNVFPDGFHFYEAKSVTPVGKSLSAKINRAVYTVTLDPPAIDVDSIGSKIEEVLAATTLEIERESKSGVKAVDIRPGIHDIQVENDTLLMTLGMGEGGFARPDEVLNLLLDDPIAQVGGRALHRKELFAVDEHGIKTDGMEL